MNAIMVGYQGMRELLDSVFGKAEQPVTSLPPRPKPEQVQVIAQPVEKLPKLTPEAFDRMFSDPKGKPN